MQCLASRSHSICTAHQNGIVGLAYVYLFEGFTHFAHPVILLLGACQCGGLGHQVGQLLLQSLAVVGIDAAVVLVEGRVDDAVGPLAHVGDSAVHTLGSLLHSTQIGEFQVAYARPLIVVIYSVSVAHTQCEGSVSHVHQQLVGVSSRSEGACGTLGTVGDIAGQFAVLHDGHICSTAGNPAVLAIHSLVGSDEPFHSAGQERLVSVQIEHSGVHVR